MNDRQNGSFPKSPYTQVISPRLYAYSCLVICIANYVGPFTAYVSWKQIVCLVIAHDSTVQQMCNNITVIGTVCRGSTLEHTFDRLKPGRTYKITIKVLAGTTSSAETSRNLATSKWQTVLYTHSSDDT